MRLGGVQRPPDRHQPEGHHGEQDGEHTPRGEGEGRKFGLISSNHVFQRLHNGV